MKKSLKKRYREIEVEVYLALREKIANSKVKSKFFNGNVLVVKGFPGMDDIEEVAVINDHLVYINNKGHYYDFFTRVLEDAIDILELFKN